MEKSDSARLVREMGKRHKASVLSVLLLVLLLALLGMSQRPRAEPKLGYLAPDFTLSDAHGRTIRLSDYRSKKAVLLNFWATWCPPCRVEMLTMEQVYQYYKEKGLEVLAISIDAGPPESVALRVSEFIKAFKLSYPALLDVQMEVARKYQVIGIPMTYLIDKGGKIRFIEMGLQDWTDSASWRKLDTLLD